MSLNSLGVDGQDPGSARYASQSGVSPSSTSAWCCEHFDTGPVPLGAGAYRLSLYRRKRWEPLPFEGSLEELAGAMNHELAAWAVDWS